MQDEGHSKCYPQHSRRQLCAENEGNLYTRERWQGNFSALRLVCPAIFCRAAGWFIFSDFVCRLFELVASPADMIKSNLNSLGWTGHERVQADAEKMIRPVELSGK
jgi:hypothetical protein